jgi:hypothetical protein
MRTRRLIAALGLAPAALSIHTFPVSAAGDELPVPALTLTDEQDCSESVVP